MNKSHFSKFEQLIAQWVEGGFARLFAGRLHPREVAIRLVRAMDEHAQSDGTGGLIAPNLYYVRLNPDDCRAIAQPNLEQTLAEHISELAVRADMRLLVAPSVSIRPDETLPPYTIFVEAFHIETQGPETESMGAVKPLPGPVPAPKNAQLVLGGSHYILLDRAVMNIGRRHENHIVIDDPRVSRLHAQLRLRFGRYTIYDLNSKGGTFVNQHRVTESILRPGDVISLAGLLLVYMEDENSREKPQSPAHDTQVYPAVKGDDEQ